MWGAGDDPLSWAVRGGHLDVVKLLLPHTRSTPRVKTAMMWAAHCGELQIVRLLVECSDQLELVDEMGWTALHWASR